MKIGVMDDKKEVLIYISNLISSIDLDYEVYLFSSINMFTKKIKELDCVIIDVFIGHISGIELASNLGLDIPVIFISELSHDSFDVYDANHIYYLDIPINTNLLEKALIKAKLKNNCRFFYYQSDFEHHYIIIDDILYFESDRRVVFIHLCGSITHNRFYSRLDFVATKVGNKFIRISKSILVNTKYISSISNRCVNLSTSEVLFISKGYMEKVLERINKL